MCVIRKKVTYTIVICRITLPIRSKGEQEHGATDRNKTTAEQEESDEK